MDAIGEGHVLYTNLERNIKFIKKAIETIENHEAEFSTSSAQEGATSTDRMAAILERWDTEGVPVRKED